MTNLLILRHAFVINRVLIRHGLEEFLTPTPLSKLTRLLKIFALTNNQNHSLNRGDRLNKALTELGPIFIKLGQMLSTRRDLLPQDLADALARLQDNVEPFDSETSIKIIEQQLGQPISEHFSEFDEKPLASASIAQVHSARLISGESVVIKVIRPGILKKIKADLKLLHLLAGWFEKYSATGKRLHVTTIIKDYETTLYNELDLRVEAANTSQLRHNFRDNNVLYVPDIYWDLCRPKVMVQERISGIPIGDITSLNTQKVNLKRLAHSGVEIFFTQVFKHSYFHADMHPGNIFVNATDPENPTYIAIDCAIMGTLNESDKRFLAQSFAAFFDRDYRKVANLLHDSGWISQQFSVEEFESAIRTACEPIFGKPLDEISFGNFLVQLFQTARRFEIEVQPQLVLLQKTLLYVEGLGRQLYPKLDLWETAQPFLNEWIKETYGPKAIFNRIKSRLPEWLEQFPDMPDKMVRLLDTSIQSNNTKQSLLYAVAQQSKQQKSSAKRLRWLGISITLILASFTPLPSWISAEWGTQTLLGLSLVSLALSFRS